MRGKRDARHGHVMREEYDVSRDDARPYVASFVSRVIILREW